MLKIFLSLTEVAGYYSHLEDGFASLGVRARVGFILKHAFRYKHIRITLLQRLVMKIIGAQIGARSRSIKFMLLFFASIPLFCYFITCLYRYNVFVFGFRRSFFPGLWDLPLLRLLNKKIIFVFHGSDARPAYLDGSLNIGLSNVYKRMVKTKRELLRIEKYAHYIVTQPAIGVLHERQLLNWVSIGMPCSAEMEEKVNVSDETLGIVLHSPSNPQAKGTFVIREVMQELKSEGYKFEYRELIGKTNQEVLAEIQKCSFVIDQLYSDIHMAGFATEAAFYGKPAIVGGYELDKLKDFLNAGDVAPSYKIIPTKENLKRAIVYLLDDKKYRENLGQEARRFVREKWAAIEVAKRFLRIIDDDIPEEWYFDPYKLNFVYGCCIENNARKKRVKEYISKYGESALCLEDKPKLKTLLLESIE